MEVAATLLDSEGPEFSLVQKYQQLDCSLATDHSFYVQATVPISTWFSLPPVDHPTFLVYSEQMHLPIYPHGAATPLHSASSTQGLPGNERSRSSTIDSH